MIVGIRTTVVKTATTGTRDATKFVFNGFSV